MNKQRGMTTAYVVIICLLALGVVSWGLVNAWDSYTTRLDKRGYDRGVSERDAAYTARDNKQLEGALKAQHTAELAAKAAEDRAAAFEHLAQTNYQKGIKDAQAKTDARIAAARDGTLVLRDPGQGAGTCAPGGGATGQGAAVAAGSGADGAGNPGLSGQATEFLLALTGESDRRALKIGRLQARLVSDLELCNSPDETPGPAHQ